MTLRYCSGKAIVSFTSYCQGCTENKVKIHSSKQSHKAVADKVYSVKKYKKASDVFKKHKRFGFMTLLQCEKKKLLYSTTQYHRHHKNDRGTPTCNSACRIYITSQFKWNWNWYSVLLAKRCLVEILWPVELKCWVSGDPRVLLRILRRRLCFFKTSDTFRYFFTKYHLISCWTTSVTHPWRFFC